ncbi:MAG: glycosyltransferase, partial [Kangiellaceae bacterium]
WMANSAAEEACAFAKLKKDNVKLLVIGSGPLQNDVEMQIQNLKLTDKITLIGRVEHQLIPNFMAACDLLCLPSLREGCPNVVLESLSCGTPVLASNVGAVPDIISREEYGIIVPACDVDELANGIDKGTALKEQELPLFEWYDWQENAQKVNGELQNMIY